jgi:hypothetical protein
LVGGLCAFNGDPDDRVNAFIFGGLPSGLVGAGLGSLLARAIGRILTEEKYLRGIRPFSHRLVHPQVKNRLEAHWKVGEKPPGA